MCRATRYAGQSECSAVVMGRDFPQHIPLQAARSTTLHPNSALATSACGRPHVAAPAARVMRNNGLITVNAVWSQTHSRRPSRRLKPMPLSSPSNAHSSPPAGSWTSSNRFSPLKGGASGSAVTMPSTCRTKKTHRASTAQHLVEIFTPWYSDTSSDDQNSCHVCSAPHQRDASLEHYDALPGKSYRLLLIGTIDGGDAYSFRVTTQRLARTTNWEGGHPIRAEAWSRRPISSIAFAV